ncbi:MAG: hypothetical protein QM496_08205 [Verrucomicrobiota bacterium]
MAIRLGNYVRSGFIDNSTRGRITGELKIKGLDEPVMIDVKGNAHPDMAGCVLSFNNPQADLIDPALADILRQVHKGFAGDISASQKRKVPKSLLDSSAASTFDPSDFVLCNTLYLEWYDYYNGRVVIEGVGYQWEIDLPRWQLTQEEEIEQAQQASSAMDLHMNLALELFEDSTEEISYNEEKIDPEANDEFAWEQRLQNSENRVDALLDLLDEAQTQEDRKVLLKHAFDGLWQEELLLVDHEFAPPESRVNGVELDGEMIDLAKNLQRKVSSIMMLIREPIDEAFDTEALLTLYVKVNATMDLVLDEESCFAPGLIIALLKREIARCQSIVNSLPQQQRDEGSLCLQDVWEIRDLLVRLSGYLRDGQTS